MPVKEKSVFKNLENINQTKKTGAKLAPVILRVFGRNNAIKFWQTKIDYF